MLATMINPLRRTRTSKSLRRDNVAPDKVVDVIKDYRKIEKINYTRYQAATKEAGKITTLKSKLLELENIFNQTSNEIEWERISAVAARSVKSQCWIMEDGFKDWAMKKNNFLLLGQKSSV